MRGLERGQERRKGPAEYPVKALAANAARALYLAPVTIGAAATG